MLADKILHHKRKKAFKLSSTCSQCRRAQLSSKAVQRPALPLQGVHHVHGSHSLSLGMLGVGHGITDDILQENLENTPGLLVDETTDPFDATPSCKSADCRLGDALNVVPQHLAVSLGSTLAQTLASFASSSHGECALLAAVITQVDPM